jgi:Flp pilus assembly protein TadD
MIRLSQKMEIAMTHTFRSLAALGLIAALGLSAPVLAAGSEDDSSATSPASAASYADAKAAVYAGNYAAAIPMLKDITAAEPQNADAWNLLGFSSRKSGDMKAASKAYAKALKINPGHLGALEYQGELVLMLGDLAAAQANLDHLTRICGTCPEREDLREAIEAAAP